MVPKAHRAPPSGRINIEHEYYDLSTIIRHLQPQNRQKKAPWTLVNTMGALLSLPLLAIPSLGTVSCSCSRGPGTLATPTWTDPSLVDDLWSLMLRGGNVFCGLQFLWEIPEQVISVEPSRGCIV